LPYLAQVTTGPEVAIDLMTGAYSLRAQVMAQVIRMPEVFGTCVTHEGNVFLQSIVDGVTRSSAH
jgi:hypothetical protein